PAAGNGWTWGRTACRGSTGHRCCATRVSLLAIVVRAIVTGILWGTAVVRVIVFRILRNRFVDQRRQPAAAFNRFVEHETQPRRYAQVEVLREQRAQETGGVVQRCHRVRGFGAKYGDEDVGMREIF